MLLTGSFFITDLKVPAGQAETYFYKRKVLLHGGILMYTKTWLLLVPYCGGIICCCKDLDLKQIHVAGGFILIGLIGNLSVKFSEYAVNQKNYSLYVTSLGNTFYSVSKNHVPCKSVGMGCAESFFFFYACNFSSFLNNCFMFKIPGNSCCLGESY